MACKTCPGGKTPSLAAERAREQRAIERRKQIDKQNAAFAQRRTELQAQIREQRRQARGD